MLASFRGLEFQLGERPRAVLFTGAGPGDGTTTCVVDFALELASAGHKAVLLDLDLRRPELASRLGVAGERNDSSSPLVPVPGEPEIEVLPGVADATRATLEDLGRRLPELIAEARSRGAFVLVDTSPLGDIEDALRFVPAVDDVVLVTRLGHTREAGVEIARDLLDRVRKPPTGFIVVGGRSRRQAGNARVAPPVGDPPQPAPASQGESLADLVEAGLLPQNAELVGRTKRQEHVARVDGGGVRLNGARYASLSAAAAAITGRETDGWTFWQTRVDGEYVPLSVLRSRLRYPAPSPRRV